MKYPNLPSVCAGTARPFLCTANILVIIFGLCALNFCCFAKTLDAYFFADDFLHLSFIHEACSKHPELLLWQSNSVWQDNGFQKFFRPAIELSFALDYMVWQGRAFGYHLSNLVWQIVNSLLVFIFAKQLFKRAERQGFWLAAASAALFAVYPLHTEVVAWPAGRVDSICSAFYLGSLCFYLQYCRQGKPRWLLGSLASYAIALASKEMAVTLPFVIACHCFLLKGDGAGNWRKRLSQSLRESKLFWLATVLYLTVRSISLGCLVGGWSGPLGESLNQSIWYRLSNGALWMVAFPFNTDVVPVHGRLSQALHWLYLGVAICLCARSCSLQLPGWFIRTTLFLIAFLLVSPLPATQVFAITPLLSGSRFFYMPSIPLCILIALLFFPVNESPAGTKLRPLQNGLCLIVLAALLACFTLICQRNCQPWVKASHEIRMLQKQITALTRTFPHSQKFVLLNLPADRNGAFMFYGCELLSRCMRPPFSPIDCSNRLDCLDSANFTDPDAINVTRLREMLRSGHCRFFWWDAERLQLTEASKQENWLADKSPEAISLAPASSAIIEQKGRPFLRFCFAPRAPLQTRFYEFVDVSVQVTAKRFLTSSSLPLRLYWDTALDPKYGRFDPPAVSLYKDSGLHVYRFCTGKRKSWFLSENPGRLFVELPAQPIETATVTITLTPATSLENRHR